MIHSKIVPKITQFWKNKLQSIEWLCQTQRAKHSRRPNSPPYLSVYTQSPTNHIKRTYHVWTKQIQLRRINTQEGSVFELDGKEGITSAFSGTKKSRCCSSFQISAIVRTRFSKLSAFLCLWRSKVDRKQRDEKSVMLFFCSTAAAGSTSAASNRILAENVLRMQRTAR